MGLRFYPLFAYSSLPSQLLEQIQLALPVGVEVFLVGGAVRDALLGRTTYDLDFVVSGEVKKISHRVADALGAAFYVMDHERVTTRLVLIQPDGVRIKLDFARMRGEDLERDLTGRDFTINAMAVPLTQLQTLIDPLAGMSDLRQKILRACSPTAFEDDPVRILRGIRLATALNYKLLPETNLQIRQSVSGLSHVSPERVRDELFRIFDGPRPATAVRLMDRMGVLPYVLPEVVALRGVHQSPPHVLDVWEHTLDLLRRLEQILEVLALDYDPEKASSWALGFVSLQLGRYRQQLSDHFISALNPDRPLRGLLVLAGLYHDCGKPAVGKTDEQGRIRFFEHEHLSAEITMQRALQLRLSNAEIKRLEQIVRHHMRPILLAQHEEQPTRRAIYRYFRATGEAGIDIGLLSLADTLATYGPTLPREVWVRHLAVIRALFEAWWENPRESVLPPPLIDGNDLMRIFELEPGPIIGQLLEAIREAQAMGQVCNREQALYLARKLLEENS